MQRSEGRRTVAHDKVEAIIRDRYKGRQGEFARDVGISTSAVSRWLLHCRKASLEQALTLEAMFGIPPRDWVTYPADAPPQECPDVT